MLYYHLNRLVEGNLLRKHPDRVPAEWEAVAGVQHSETATVWPRAAIMPSAGPAQSV
jgi:hypothetical protein